jgi:hypothetical protein
MTMPTKNSNSFVIAFVKEYINYHITLQVCR